MLKYVPNILTIIRFFLIPFSVYFLINEQYIIAIAFIILSAITDILDGTIARKYNYITNFGKLLDPLADKLTLLSILFVLVAKNIIYNWLLIVILIKEITMVIGASFLYGKDLVVSSKWYGKASTVLFYISILLSLIVKEFNKINYVSIIEKYNFLNYIDKPFYYLALLTSIFSLIMYFRAFYIHGYIKKENLKITKQEEPN